CVVVVGRNQYLGEDFDYGVSGRFIDGTVESNNAAECGNRISRERFEISLNSVRAQAHTSRVGVFDDRAGGLFEITDKLPGRVRIDVVVERHFLPGKKFGIGNPVLAGSLVQTGNLMWILPVSQIG